MPPDHLNYPVSSAANAKFLTVICDPVSTLSSLRRMEQLLFGKMAVGLDKSVRFNLEERETGWLEYVLKWWALRENNNVLILK